MHAPPAHWKAATRPENDIHTPATTVATGSRVKAIAAADFYPEIGQAIGAEDIFDSQRTHLWRSTLNSLMLDIPVEVRAAYFGHDKAANQKYYTDTTDVTPVVEAARRLR